MNKLPELIELERIIQGNHSFLAVRTICDIGWGQNEFPVYSISLGNPNPDIPAVGFFGGIHGLERIGTSVLLTFLRSLIARLTWDRSLHRQLSSLRLVFMPLVNPAGMSQSTRSNFQGVDLMRNAPIECSRRASFLVGGQRISPRLPWFRGHINQPMQAECRAVCEVVEQELLTHRFSVALDCHSGFGIKDRIWFPYAHTTTPIEHLPEICALENLFSMSYPNHSYLFEPQSRQYLTHGDLWDYLYMQNIQDKNRIFLPLTLEMGSWGWVRKNPVQLFSKLGLFNPLPAHRLQRVLHRHMIWLDFLARATCGYKQWSPLGSAREQQRQLAFARWYPRQVS
jgi:hypothetical protein